ncbi:MAG TPA: response regulator [Chthoniobacterales bacterium]|nr:response regulator [Chthoniobacterales bacterium]
MPARPKSTNTDGPQPNIVLLEEYDALAAAISSALKKFAPQHAGFVARSIKELEKLGSELDPELFILDVDPPWAGITDALQRFRDAHPKARALVIGTAIPPEIATRRGLLGGLQFVEKPFELAAFGAAVQALLGPWRELEARGALHVLSTIDMLLLHRAAGANVILEAQSRTRTGEIHIATGQLSHAETGKMKGDDALAEILTWPKAHLSERKLTGSSRRTLGAGWPAIIVEALQETGPEIPEPPRPQPPTVQPKAGKKIVLIDDTEMLRVFVEDVLAIAQPDWQITTATNGSEGLREVQQVHPDLVLLDYSMPDFNGDEVCRQLLENANTAQVPILMMSGHVAQMKATAAKFGNVVATIEKPFLSEALVDLVRRTLAGERLLIKREPTVEPAAPAPPREQVAPQPVVPPPAPPPPPRQIIPPEPRRRVKHEPVAPPPPPAPTKLEEKIAPPEPPPRPLSPAEAYLERQTPMPARGSAVRIAPTDGNGAILGLFLEVVSMQLTSQLQMGAIRARPSSLTGSLRLESAAARNAIPPEIGFQLGPAQFSAEGRVSELRMIPTWKPPQTAQMRNAFEIGGVALIPNENRARVQLTPAGTTPMTMELFAYLELSAVELTPGFQVAQLILNWRTNAVRVTLNPKAPEQTAAKFDMRVEKLDNAGRIAQVLLRPIQ